MGWLGDPPTRSEVPVVAIPKSGPDDEDTGELKLRMIAPVWGSNSRICSPELSRAKIRLLLLPARMLPKAAEPFRGCAVARAPLDSASSVLPRATVRA